MGLMKVFIFQLMTPNRPTNEKKHITPCSSGLLDLCVNFDSTTWRSLNMMLVIWLKQRKRHHPETQLMILYSSSFFESFRSVICLQRNLNALLACGLKQWSSTIIISSPCTILLLGYTFEQSKSQFLTGWCAVFSWERNDFCTIWYMAYCFSLISCGRIYDSQETTLLKKSCQQCMHGSKICVLFQKNRSAVYL